jgi:hypothetical protein
MRTIKNLTLASTARDLHGEQYDKQFLLDLAARMPGRVPLHQQHDMGQPTVGFMENLRVESDTDGWALRVDVTFEGEPPTSAGLSFSTTELLLSVDESPFEVFVPHPYYNDRALLAELAEANPDASIGRWIRKSVDASQVALTISTVILGGVWKKTYDEHVHPRLAAIVASVTGAIQKKNGGRTVRVEVLQPILVDGHPGPIELYFIPSEHAEIGIAYGFAVEEATADAMALAKADWERSHKPIRRIVYLFEPDGCRYRATQIIYADGGVRAL